MSMNRRQFAKLCGISALAASTACGTSNSNLDGSVSGDGSTPGGDGSSPDDGATPRSDGGTPDANYPGLYDNRVVRIHCSRAQDWDFNNAPGNRPYDSLDASAINDMIEQGLRDLAGENSTPAAWNAIMRHKNPAGYQAGQKVAIKVNNNNQGGDPEGQPNTDPIVIKAVIAGLKSIGVAESDITCYDAVRRQLARQRDAVKATYPNVVFQGAWEGITWNDSERVVFEETSNQRLPTCLTNADHLINLHLFKGHGPGVTGSMKNHFGTIEDPDTLHTWRNTGAVIAEISNNPHVKNKSRLLLTEAIFGHSDNEWEVSRRFNRTNLYPEGTPNSVFLSTNPVCLDSVLYDHIGAEAAYNAEYHGPDTWLHIAAETYGLGIHENGTMGSGTYSNEDLHYSQIEYLNRSIA